MKLKKPNRRSYKVAIFTTQVSVCHIVDYLRDHCEIVGIILPENRRESTKITSVVEWCKERNYSLYWHKSSPKDTEELNDRLLKERVDLGLSWNYSQILSSDTLNVFPDGVWNMHGGKIPEYRGANVLQWAIINGEKEIGITWHKMDAQIDGGEILGTSLIPIGPGENAVQIGEKVNQEAIMLFQKLWQKYSGDGIETVPVNTASGNYYRRRHPEDGLIPAKCTIETVKNYLRALPPPWPAPVIDTDGCFYYVLDTMDATGQTIEYQCIDGTITLSVKKIINIDFLNKLKVLCKEEYQ